MDTNNIRALWLEETLAEEPIPENSLPRTLQGKSVNLLLRELSADEAGDIIDACTDKKTNKLNQKKFMALVLAASVRNANDPEKGLVWDETFVQPLLSKRLKPLLTIATQSINLSGLNDQIVNDQKKDSEPTIVEGSLSA